MTENEKKRPEQTFHKNKRSIGTFYEEKAAQYLEQQGVRVIMKNYRCHAGEIDLIAQDKEYLVFVEVKYRSSKRSGSPLAAVDKTKQRIISRVARNYLLVSRHTESIPCRFDVIGFDGGEVLWIKNAFDCV